MLLGRLQIPLLHLLQLFFQEFEPLDLLCHPAKLRAHVVPKSLQGSQFHLELDHLALSLLELGLEVLDQVGGGSPTAEAVVEVAAAGRGAAETAIEDLVLYGKKKAT